MSPSLLWTLTTPPSSGTWKTIHHGWFLGCWLLPVPLKSLSDWKHQSLCCSAITLTGKKQKKHQGRDIPCWSPLGNETFPLSRIRQPPYLVIFFFFLSFVPFMSQLLEHEAIYQWTDLTVMLFMLAVLFQEKTAKVECVCLATKNTLFIFQITGKHPSAVFATGRKQHYLPRTQHERINHHQWKNPSSNPRWEERFVIPVSLVLGGERRRCDSVQNGETRANCQREREQKRREDKKGKVRVLLDWVWERTESLERSYRKKLNIFINLFSWSSPTAVGGLNHVMLDWIKGGEGDPARGGSPPPQKNQRLLITLSSPSLLRRNHS